MVFVRVRALFVLKALHVFLGHPRLRMVLMQNNVQLWRQFGGGLPTVHEESFGSITPVTLITIH